MGRPLIRTLKAVCAGAGIFCAAAFQHAQETQADTPRADSFAALTVRAARLAQVVHLADVSHKNNSSFMRRLASPGFMQNMRRAGFTTIALETSVELQSVADRLAAGKISRNEYASILIGRGFGAAGRDSREAFLEEADIIRAAASSGIRIAFVDVRNGEKEAQIYHKALHEAGINSRYRDFGLEGEFGKRYPLLPDAQKKKVAELRRAYIEARTNDTQLADKIAPLTADGGKVLLIYGASHGSGLNDLNEMLDARGVSLLRVNVYASQLVMEASADPESDPPEARYLLSEDKILPTAHTPAALTP